MARYLIKQEIRLHGVFFLCRNFMHFAQMTLSSYVRTPHVEFHAVTHSYRIPFSDKSVVTKKNINTAISMLLRCRKTSEILRILIRKFV
jgi:hypothetical protein